MDRGTWLLHMPLALECVCVLVAQSCLALCNVMDCSLPSSSVHGILQARILFQGLFPTQELIPSAQRLVWAAKQALGNAALGALFA